jgi:Nif-specific regulatory protein
MNAKLVALDGPVRGAVFHLDADSVALGRKSSNGITLSDSSVSRRHCLISRLGTEYRVVDLDSQNGTLVNGVPVKERLLASGDQIQLGECLFLFVQGLDSVEAEPLWADEILPENSTLILAQQSAAHRPGRRRPDTETLRILENLLEIGTSLNSATGVDDLSRRLILAILDVIPLERGAIVLVGDEASAEPCVMAWHRSGAQVPSFPLNRHLIDRCMRDRVAAFSNCAGATSHSGSKTVLVVPLTRSDRVLGMAYLDSDTVAGLHEEHLEFLMAVASIGAIALGNALQARYLEAEKRRLEAELDMRHDLIGESAAMREVHHFIDKVAPLDATVLISGESGTGKELVARAIHRASPRASGPFIAINCATLSEALLESELFGHEKGAFTGAVALKRGKLEAAQGGTLFLDEIGELKPPLQAKLLRVLQEREFERVGGTRTIRVDLRVIAATNRVLENAVAGGDFREDLYFRLNVLSIRVPPLRERKSDIPLLAVYFLQKLRRSSARRVAGISQAARALLLNHAWPGNVREMENAIERAVVMGSHELIQPEDLPEGMLELPSTESLSPFHAGVREAKKRIIAKAFERARGNYSEAARLLGVNPTYLHRLIRNLNLKPALKASRSK